MPIRTIEQVKKSALKQCPHNSGFKLNEKVTFTNDNGVVFPGHKIIGFVCEAYDGAGTIYLDYDCHWFPARPDQLTKE